MKRKFILFSLLIIISLGLSKNVHALYCLVSAEDGDPLNIAGLPWAVSEKYNSDTLEESGCSNPDGSYDRGLFFRQSIRFATREAGWWNDVNGIVLRGPLVFDNPIVNVAVGNFPLVLPPDEDYAYNYRPEYDADPTWMLSRDDYGIVTLYVGRENGSGSSLSYFESEELPLECAPGTKRAIMRNLIINTYDITKEELFDIGASDTFCLRDGGAVYVCPGIIKGEPGSLPGSEPDDIPSEYEDWRRDPTPEELEMAWCDQDADDFTIFFDCNDLDGEIHPDAHEECDGVNTRCCDGIDNNCINGPDENATDLENPCSDGVGACEDTGEYVCSPDGTGTICNATAGEPGTELCGDDIDNDCDGDTDEGFDEIGDECSVGVGACERTGVLICNIKDRTATICSVVAGKPSEEVCDGIDNDCDGPVDEGLGTVTCGLGVCEHTVDNCVDGVPQECDPFEGAASDDATCDNADDDCDGLVDEDYVDTPTTCGIGACADNTGTLSCVDGVEVDSCDPLEGAAADDATCDDVDDDCDDVTDEDYVETDTTCGVGECAGNTGTLSCVDGVEVDSCDPTEGAAADDATCDGVDDDCDDVTDEDYVETPTTCGVGACTDNTGTLSCVDGAEVDSCNPTEGAAADDATCDGVNDDCDDVTDEDYVETETTCGVGACTGNTGTLSCVDGAEVDSCNPTEGAAADDATCDGVDDDCDGIADDDYVETETTCGVGACTDNTGTLSCVDGVEVDSCNPLEGAAADDATCDSVDGDCDGSVDEDYVETPTSCGVGACISEGTITCVGGVETDSCTPGDPAADDATCDNIDDDCDDVTDEDYVETDTTCGEGECASSGRLTCVGGAETDSCTPGDPEPEICDGLDNDCDGDVDEDGGVTDWYEDSDSDGFGNPAVSVVACDAPPGFVNNNRDCDDDNAAINPAVAEVCDGIDNDCDGDVDEDDAIDVRMWYRDGDADLFGNPDPAAGVKTCEVPPGYVADNTDCDDDNAAINPAAVEVCDGADNDCNGDIDEAGAVGEMTWYQDSDGDTFGNPDETLNSCVVPGGYVGDNTDCDDSDAAVNPDADEICDDVDNDCDGDIDEDDTVDASTWYLDSDTDTFGDPDVSVVACDIPEGYVADDTDCDDTNAAINPAAAEICGDDIDQDCSGEDLECPVGERDDDGDGFCDDLNGDGICEDGTRPGDCNDFDATINPDAEEVCDGRDNDCDGRVDYTDSDDDDYYSVCPDDCDDEDDSIHPGAEEICGDGIDQDCDGADLPCPGGETDDDGDGYCEDENGDGNCDDATKPGDCDDTNPSIHPNADPDCSGSLDADCDGEIDSLQPICIEVELPPEFSGQVEGGAGGCGCYLASPNQGPTASQMILFLMTMIPAVIVGTARRRVRARNSS